MAAAADLEERKRKLAVYLPFEALETPKWRKKQEVTVAEMITEIMRYNKQWEEVKNTYDEELVEKVRKEFLVQFIFHVNMEEESGFSTFEETENFLTYFYARAGNLQRSLSIKEHESINVRNAYQYLLDKIKTEEQASDYGLIEEGLLQETHRKLMANIVYPIGKTKPGKFSNEPRRNDFNGKRYYYRNPQNMENAVTELVEKYNNYFYLCTKDGLKDFDDFYYLFKTCAWLLFELLDLHPFSDGNGRLCRIFCSYMLSKLNPFPTPVYNVWTDSKKSDYQQALVDARESDTRHPRALTTMIIECNYHGWRKFFEALDEKK
ncbi:hypothetical protein OS493_003056 [Desmophyllum pertusum]|uniref:Fido domain-containing protein n=1 Tax=Desmophyllum pertusum TaxID=174260 RepID=A0A9W9YGN1_9CNID|nr:hypothetical protein OS493_003056 [Desmophyllum pertusum]